MATLPQTPIPSPSSSFKEVPLVLKARFGGGYEQRTGDGPPLNILRNWNLVWENITRAQMKTLNDFFRARGGVEKFGWVQLIPFDGEGELTFICEDYGPGTYLGGEIHRYTAQLEQRPAL